jgi:hypothetical protein
LDVNPTSNDARRERVVANLVRGHFISRIFYVNGFYPSPIQEKLNE